MNHSTQFIKSLNLTVQTFAQFAPKDATARKHHETGHNLSLADINKNENRNIVLNMGQKSRTVGQGHYFST